ncbi:MAG: hypothetical protein KBD24_01890 [Candidatus Pacebacteria bacterium]|nr:hypothetical protein [Candidatus Paceibacterota bacterium]
MDPEKIAGQGGENTSEDKDAGQSNHPFTPLGSVTSSTIPVPSTPFQQFEQSPHTPQTSVVADEYSRPGWSWGAFINGPMFLIGTRQYSYLWMYVLYFIPFVNIIAWFGVMIYLGMKGRELAAESKTFTNRDQYVGYMKATDHGGKVFAILSILIIIPIMILASVALSSLSGARDRTREAADRAEQRVMENQRLIEEDAYEYIR